MSDRIILSIIVPVYNAAEYLDRFMGGLMSGYDRETADGFEVILVDDGSTDESPAKINDYAGRYPNVKVIHQKNAGPAAARNAGLDAASGKWIWFADPDDEPVEGAVAGIIGRVSHEADQADHGRVQADIYIFDAYEHKGDKVSRWEHFDKAGVFADRTAISAVQRQVLYPHLSPQDARIFRTQRFGAYDTPIAAPWDKVYRHDFLKCNDLRFPDKLRVLDDMFFNLRAFGAAGCVEYVKEPIYHYYRNLGSITASYKPDRIERDMEVFKAIESYISDRSDKDHMTEHEAAELLMAYCKRVVKSFAISLRLCLFNKNNPDSLTKKLKWVKKVLSLDIYRKAFLAVRYADLEWMLKPVVFMGRRKMAFGLYLLASMR